MIPSTSTPVLPSLSETSPLLPSSSPLPKSTSISVPTSLQIRRDIRGCVRGCVGERGLRELYEVLPMYAAFGLSRRSDLYLTSFARYAKGAIKKKSRGSLAEAVIEEEIINIKERASEDVVTLELMKCVVIASSLQLLVGFTTSSLNPIQPYCFKDTATTFSWAIAVSAYALGGPIGTLLPKLYSKEYKRLITLNLVMFLVSGLMQSLAPTLLVLTIGRFLSGAASGFSTTIVPLYLGSISPPTLRGSIGTVTQFSCVIGILLSSLLSIALSRGEMWRSLLMFTPLMSFVALMFVSSISESPFHLASTDPTGKVLRSVIKKLRGFKHDKDVEIEIMHIKAANEAQSEKSVSASSAKAAANVTISSILSGKSGNAFVVCVALHVCQQLCGINAIFYYSTYFFSAVISDPLYGSTSVAAVNVLATYVALVLMDRCERRFLVRVSCAGMLACVLSLLACTETSLKSSLPTVSPVVAVIGFVSFFEVGMGPIPWLLPGEILEPRIVPAAMECCCQVNWACNFIIGATFPILQDSFGYMSFAPFAIVLVMTLQYADKYLPETATTVPEDLKREMNVRRKSFDVGFFGEVDGGLPSAAAAAPQSSSSSSSRAPPPLSSSAFDSPTTSFYKTQEMEWLRAMAQIQQEESDSYAFVRIPGSSSGSGEGNKGIDGAKADGERNVDNDEKMKWMPI